ncbi:glycosyltransferase [Anabaena sp. UHCC 0399]|uniref:glycosyltransferase n=1 Tax=Anabaena sp. UHCC 0399 TaxID=3110238 RepID=UPI002B1EA3C0|nr:glycosyltransferase [Anabaena sp. UHCC 0399]MEA5566435.1 glycosyltransferase [Anabaena sp. UHCC 0399]
MDILQDAPHVAIFLRTLVGGGAKRVMLNLANTLTEQNFKVDLVLSHLGGPYLSQVSSKVRIVDLKAPKLPLSLPKLVSYLRQNKPLNLLSALHYPCEVAIWAKYISGVSTQVIVSERNTLSQEAKYSPEITARLTPLAARLFYPLADKVIAISKGVANDLAQITKIPAESIQVIYNPVITQEILHKAQESVEHPWFQPGELPVILSVGRLMQQKDFPILIRAFARVLKVRSARLVILGSGRERSHLDKLVRELGLQDHVAMLGFQKNPYAFMARASVFALSSAWEGFGNVLVEAMALGTPVVSTDCPNGPGEILNRGKYGLLVPVGDDAAMAEAIVNTLSGNCPTVDSHWLEQFTSHAAMNKYIKLLDIA